MRPSRGSAMMIAYLFSLGLGGVLLVASIVLGGDGESDALALDGGGDLELGGDAELGQQGLATAHADAHGSMEGFIAGFLSLRFWTFALAFFGLTGVVLGGLALAGPVATAIIAGAMGLVVGRGTVAAFHALRAGESSFVATESDYVGKSARVLLGFAPGETGKLRLELKGTTVDLLARSDDPTPFRTGDDALIVQIEGHVAIVTHTGRELGPASAETGT